MLAQKVLQTNKEEDFAQYLNNQEPSYQQVVEQNIKVDEHFNLQTFLGKEGMFSKYKMIIGQFYTGEGFKDGFIQTAGKELNSKGFTYDIVYNEMEFAEKLCKYNIAWIFPSQVYACGSKFDETKFLKCVEQFMKDKNSLFIWTDNDPYNTQCNLILNQFFDGMHVQGNFYGAQIVTGGAKGEKQKFDLDHTISYGLRNLHEGITISHPEKIHKDFQIFAYNSNNEPLIVFADENENHGRIIVDCGYTKLFPQFYNNAGTHQYVSNANVWLTGIPDNEFEK